MAPVQSEVRAMPAPMSDTQAGTIPFDQVEAVCFARQPVGQASAGVHHQNAVGDAGITQVDVSAEGKIESRTG